MKQSEPLPDSTLTLLYLKAKEESIRLRKRYAHTSSMTALQASKPIAPDVKIDEISEKSWKYIGYRQFSKFLSSDNDFISLRRFGNLHVRVLLTLQDEITVLESQLETIDQNASRITTKDTHNGTLRDDEVTKRGEVVKEIKKKLVEYGSLLLAVSSRHFAKLTESDKFLLRTSRLRALPTARSHDVASVSNWLFNNNDPIKSAEVEYLEHPSDLVPLVPKERSSLRRILEKWSGFRLSSLWRTDPVDACPEVELRRDHTYYSSDERVERFLVSVVLITGVAMLISPLWILHAVQDKTTQLGIITSYIVMFIGLLSFSTVASPFESLAAAAAWVLSTGRMTVMTDI